MTQSAVRCILPPLVPVRLIQKYNSECLAVNRNLDFFRPYKVSTFPTINPAHFFNPNLFLLEPYMESPQCSEAVDGLTKGRTQLHATLLLLRRAAIMIAIGAVGGACTCWATYYFGLLAGLLSLFFSYVLFSHTRDVDALLKSNFLFPPEKALPSLRWSSAGVGVLAEITALLGFARFAILIIDNSNHNKDAANAAQKGVDLVTLIGAIVAVSAFNLIGVFSFISFLKLKDIVANMSRAGLSFPAPGLASVPVAAAEA
jgi:hypothetical protein